MNFKSNEPVLGWDVNCADVPSSAVKNCKNWNCPSRGKKSSITTKLYGTGRARLDFGNCGKNKNGKVKVLLDNREIALAGKGKGKAKHKHSNVVEFDFTSDTTLKIVGEKGGITQINHFEVLSCQTGAGK